MQNLFASRAGRHHPEEQGLKQVTLSFAISKLNKAGRHHPEEQGLKLEQVNWNICMTTMPVGIIQKNKD